MVRTRARVRQATDDDADVISFPKSESEKQTSMDIKEDGAKKARNNKKRKSANNSLDEAVTSESSRKRGKLKSTEAGAMESQFMDRKKQKSDPVKKPNVGSKNAFLHGNDKEHTNSKPHGSRINTNDAIRESSCSSDDESDWEEVGGESSASGVAQHGHPLEITLEPHGQRTKEEELKRVIQKALRKMFHEARRKLHQMTLLCYTAHTVSLSKLCNDDLLQSIALSIIPTGFTTLKSKSLDDDQIVKFTKWFKNAFVRSDPLKQTLYDNTKSHFINMIRRKNYGDYKDLACLFVLFTRSLGWQCRIVVSLPVSTFTSLSDSLKKSQKVEFAALDNKSANSESKSQSASDKLKPFKSNRTVVSDAPKSGTLEDEEKSQKKDDPCNYWAEVYKEKNETWIPINCAQQTINDCKSIENGASLPILYVLSADNDNTVKDVTARYNSSYVVKSIRKLRLEEEWWQNTLNLRMFKSKKPLRERLEDMQLEKLATDLPFPTKIADFKHHPIYVLKRDILKFQLIYPVDVKPAGLFRDEPVYLRENLHTLHTKETWLKDARSVKDDAEPLKKVKGRQKSNKNDDEDRMIPLYGKWQTKKYVPPIAKDGIVPRNQFGNVDLFKECMLPRGTVHLRHPGMLQIAKKLQIDCAQAMIGWDFHGRSSHPVFDGVIVCKEYEKMLIDAWDQDQAILVEKEKERQSKRALKNWKRLIKGLMSRDQVKTKFGKVPESKTDDEAGMSYMQDSSVLSTSNVSTQPSWLKNCDEFTFSGY